MEINTTTNIDLIRFLIKDTDKKKILNLLEIFEQELKYYPTIYKKRRTKRRLLYKYIINKENSKDIKDILNGDTYPLTTYCLDKSNKRVFSVHLSKGWIKNPTQITYKEYKEKFPNKNIGDISLIDKKNLSGDVLHYVEHVWKNIPIYYFSIKFTGLRKYDNFDKQRIYILKKLIEYFNNNNINVDIKHIDIAYDVKMPSNYKFIAAPIDKNPNNYMTNTEILELNDYFKKINNSDEYNLLFNKNLIKDLANKSTLVPLEYHPIYKQLKQLDRYKQRVELSIDEFMKIFIKNKKNVMRLFDTISPEYKKALEEYKSLETKLDIESNPIELEFQENYNKTDNKKKSVKEVRIDFINVLKNTIIKIKKTKGLQEVRIDFINAIKKKLTKDKEDMDFFNSISDNEVILGSQIMKSVKKLGKDLDKKYKPLKIYEEKPISEYGLFMKKLHNNLDIIFEKEKRIKTNSKYSYYKESEKIIKDTNDFFIKIIETLYQILKYKGILGKCYSNNATAYIEIISIIDVLKQVMIDNYINNIKYRKPKARSYYYNKSKKEDIKLKNEVIMRFEVSFNLSSLYSERAERVSYERIKEFIDTAMKSYKVLIINDEHVTDIETNNIIDALHQKKTPIIPFTKDNKKKYNKKNILFDIYYSIEKTEIQKFRILKRKKRSRTVINRYKKSKNIIGNTITQNYLDKIISNTEDIYILDMNIENISNLIKITTTNKQVNKKPEYIKNILNDNKMYEYLLEQDFIDNNNILSEEIKNKIKKENTESRKNILEKISLNKILVDNKYKTIRKILKNSGHIVEYKYNHYKFNDELYSGKIWIERDFLIRSLETYIKKRVKTGIRTKFFYSHSTRKTIAKDIERLKNYEK